MMNRILVAAIGGFLAVAGATSTSAQDRFRDFGQPVDNAQTRANGALRSGAQCALLNVAPSVRKVLETTPGSKEEASRTKSMTAVSPECFPRESFTFDSTALHNALAEMTYLSRYGDKEPDLSSLGSEPPASFGVVPAGASGTPAQESTWALAALANCTVFVAPHDVRKLIMGPSDLPEEQTRFDVLKPAIGRCTHDPNMSALTPHLFRGFLANALLTRTQAAK